MSADPLAAFAQVWLVDFEFSQPDGERPTPLCMVAREWRTGETLRLWREGLGQCSVSPVPVGDDVLFVAYYASAELGCYLELGWPLPTRILDLCAEFRCITSGIEVPCGRGLVGAMAFYGLSCIDAADKMDMRALAMRGGPYTAGERAALLTYCETDVFALAKLLAAMLPSIGSTQLLGRALLRGRYMAAAARMERCGVPVDAGPLQLLRDSWGDLQDRLIEAVDRSYGVYDGRTFKADRFAAYLAAYDIPWPRLPSGALALDGDTFRQMAKSHPTISPLRELRHSLSELRLESLAVGNDGRNRCLLSAFSSKTSRNQPSNSRFIFGPGTWLRGLIRPDEGRAVAYVDWCQQEFGIAAALSGDKAMMLAYTSGDPYLEFAKQAGAVSKTATRETHGDVRDQFKVCALAVQYGMQAASLAANLGSCEARARELLQLHRQTYPKFWEWSQSAVDHAMLRGSLSTVFGWQVHVGANANPRSLANFPMQANGAEMLRLACCLATERGLNVCCPVHDALLIEAEADRIEEVVAACQAAMREASRVVLDGFELRSDARIVRWPDRYMDPRGEKFWTTVWGLLGVDPDAETCCGFNNTEMRGDVADLTTPVLLKRQQGCCYGAPPAPSTLYLISSSSFK